MCRSFQYLQYINEMLRALNLNLRKYFLSFLQISRYAIPELLICTISLFPFKYKVSLIINKSKSLLKWKLLLFDYVFNLDVQQTFYINHAWVI